MIEKFEKNLIHSKNNEYYFIIKEISKLNRIELLQFRKRFDLAVEKARNNELIIPYRMNVPRTDCSFILIPLALEKVDEREDIIYFLTEDNKYDLKSRKSIGLLIHQDINDKNYFELLWSFMDEEWKYNEEMENIIKNHLLLRETTTKNNDNLYK